MAALDFPASPTNGQTYSNWIYDSSITAWKSQPQSAQAAVASSTAPTSPSAGDLWYNTDSGLLYTYYNDGTSSQWVEIKANSYLATTLGTRVDALEVKSPNYIINGGFDIWQRGTSFAAPTSNYTADRWLAPRAGFATGHTVTRQASGLTGFQYCVRTQRDSGNTSTASLYIGYNLETVSSLPLAGKTVTLSFYARAGASYSASSNSLSAYIRTGTGTDQNSISGVFTGQVDAVSGSGSLSTSWQRFSFTGTLGAAITQVGIAIIGTPVGTAGANDYFEITGVQLEEGSIATPFRRNANSIQGELAACQRYYWRNTPGTNNGAHGSGYTVSTTYAMGFVPIPVTPRTLTVIPDWSGIAFQVGVSGAAVVAVSSVSIDQVATNMMHVGLTTTGSWTANYQGRILNATTTSGYLGFSAEL